MTNEGLETYMCIQEIESEVETLSREQRESEKRSKRMRKKNCPISGWRSAGLWDFCPFPRNERQRFVSLCRAAEESILYFLHGVRAGQVVPS